MRNRKRRRRRAALAIAAALGALLWTAPEADAESDSRCTELWRQVASPQSGAPAPISLRCPRRWKSARLLERTARTGDGSALRQVASWVPRFASSEEPARHFFFSDAADIEGELGPARYRAVWLPFVRGLRGPGKMYKLTTLFHIEPTEMDADTRLWLRVQLGRQFAYIEYRF